MDCTKGTWMGTLFKQTICTVHAPLPCPKTFRMSRISEIFDFPLKMIALLTGCKHTNQPKDIDGIICLNTEIKNKHLNSLLVVNSNQAHIVTLMLINDTQCMEKQHKRNNFIDLESERERESIDGQQKDPPRN